MGDVKLKDDSFIVLQSFMVNELHLSGNELMLYAIIYGFSQDGESWYTGSRNYLALWTNSTPKTVTTNIKKLLDRGLIQKRSRIERGITINDYKATITPGGKKLPSTEVKTSPVTEVKTSPHNIDIDNLVNNISKGTKKFVPPTLDEVTSYIKEKGYSVNPEQFYAYYESNGWKVGRNSMKSWKAAITNWSTKSFNSKPKEQPRADYSDVTEALKEMGCI